MSSIASRAIRFSSAIPRRSIMLMQKRLLADRVSEAYRSFPARIQQEKEIMAGRGHTTRSMFERQVKLHRTTGADADTGVQPTKWQRRHLVLTRLYERQSDIPQFVANGTMNRMHDRLRVVFIVVGVVSFFTIYFLAESSMAEKIERDRAAGVVMKSG